MPLLTREKRRKVCIHEAGHAVVAALGENPVYSIEVAPEGWTNWVTQGGKAGELMDLWGVCQTPNPGVVSIGLRWKDDVRGFQVEGQVLSAYMKALEQTGSDLPAEVRRAVRAYVCQCLAGPIAEMISANEPKPFVEPGEPSPHDDATVAEACCRMLPSGKEAEWSHLHEITESVLREHWSFVAELADVLEASGRLDERVDDYLPPQLKHWPPSPRRLREEQSVGPRIERVRLRPRPSPG